MSWSANRFGRGFLRVLCVPIALFFLLTARDHKVASRVFLSRVLNRKPTLVDMFRHFYTFALVSGDRLLFLAGKSHHFKLEFHGDEIVRRYAQAQQGCLLLVSHVGSFDAMRVPAIEDERFPLHILIDKRHNPAAMQIIETLNPELAEAAIDASRDTTDLVLLLNDALAKGAMIGVMADRAGPGERTLDVCFLGDSAPLPLGPWTLAAVLKVPVILCFAIYQGGNNYKVTFKQVADGSAVPRGQRRAIVQQNIVLYAEQLAHIARAHPYNWFNFYDFWAHDSTSDH